MIYVIVRINPKDGKEQVVGERDDFHVASVDAKAMGLVDHESFYTVRIKEQ